MDVLQAVEGLKQHLEAFARSAAEKIEQELPVLGSFVQQAATNPVVIALANAEHLNGAPEYLQALATEIQKIDAFIGSEKAKSAADAQAQAADAAAHESGAQPTAEQTTAQPA